MATIRRAASGDSDPIAELYERSFATLAFLPVLHALDELRRQQNKGRAVSTNGMN